MDGDNMKRFLILTLVFLYTGASSLSAQSQRDDVLVARHVIVQRVEAPTVATDRKGVQRAVVVNAARQAPTPTQKKSFWRSPWPYVIMGAAAVAVIVARANGAYGASGGSGSSGGY
jgi:hypothetical protein